MPIHYDILDHEVIGPAIRQGRKEAKAEGLAAGLAAGKLEEAAALAQRQLTARFGALSPKTKKRLGKLTLPELEDLAIRLLTAKSITELFPVSSPGQPCKPESRVDLPLRGVNCIRVLAELNTRHIDLLQHAHQVQNEQNHQHQS